MMSGVGRQASFEHAGNIREAGVATIIEGEPTAVSGKFCIVVSRYHRDITSRLLEAALDTLTRHGVAAEEIDVVWVPGAWEIPLAAGKLARSADYQALLTLGAVIRGETTHDQHINRQVSVSLGNLSMETGIPIAFGVLTCDTPEQAIHRSGGNQGNKGEECALAALEMANLMRKLSSG